MENSGTLNNLDSRNFLFYQRFLLFMLEKQYLLTLLLDQLIIENKNTL